MLLLTGKELAQAGRWPQRSVGDQRDRRLQAEKPTSLHILGPMLILEYNLPQVRPHPAPAVWLAGHDVAHGS